MTKKRTKPVEKKGLHTALPVNTSLRSVEQESVDQVKNPLPFLTAATARSIAYANAAATYDTVVGQHIGEDAPLPRGKYWYRGGEALPPKQHHQIIEAMCDFLEAHPTASAEACFIQTTTVILKEKRGAFGDLSLAERMAWGLFSATLPELLATVAKQTANNREKLRPNNPPPPDFGRAERVGRREPRGARIGEKIGGRRPHQTTREAAE